MSNRLKAVLAIEKTKVATLDDLCDQIPAWNRKKITDTIKDLVKVGIASRLRDDITGLPAYSLTNYGKQWLKDQPTKDACESSDTQAVRGDISTADKHRPAVVDGATMSGAPPAEGLSDVEAGQHDRMHADPASGELRYALLKIRQALHIEHDESIGIVPTIEMLVESNNEWRKAADNKSLDSDRWFNRVLELETELAGAYDELTDLKNAAENSKKQPSTAKSGVNIKPCVFCGHDDIDIDEVGVGEYVITCPECNAIGPQSGEIMSAVALWNERLVEAAA